MNQSAVHAEVIQRLRDAAMLSPVVVILEDLHWSDAASLDLLRLVSRDAHRPPLLIIATYRHNDVAQQRRARAADSWRGHGWRGVPAIGGFTTLGAGLAICTLLSAGTLYQAERQSRWPLAPTTSGG